MRPPRNIVAPTPVKPKKLGRHAILFNVGAGVIILAGWYTAVQTTFFPSDPETCATRFERSTTLSLDAGGEQRSAADFQAAANGRDAGVVENLSIRREPGGRIPTSMVVKFDEQSSKPLRDGQANGGVTFPWESRMFEGKTSACLSYSVLIPADFKFGGGGTLPGLVSIVSGEAAEPGAGFQYHPVWNRHGEIILSAYVNNSDSPHPTFFAKRPMRISTGKWVRIDQELVLNSPGKADGISRLWINGAVAAEVYETAMRRSADVKIGPVAVDVHFGGNGLESLSPKAQSLAISPIEMRWN